MSCCLLLGELTGAAVVAIMQLVVVCNGVHVVRCVAGAVCRVRVLFSCFK
jgi:hypothetical protein